MCTNRPEDFVMNMRNTRTNSRTKRSAMSHTLGVAWSHGHTPTVTHNHHQARRRERVRKSIALTVLNAQHKAVWHMARPCESAVPASSFMRIQIRRYITKPTQAHAPNFCTFNFHTFHCAHSTHSNVYIAQTHTHTNERDLRVSAARTHDEEIASASIIIAISEESIEQPPLCDAIISVGRKVGCLMLFTRKVLAQIGAVVVFSVVVVGEGVHSGKCP